MCAEPNFGNGILVPQYGKPPTPLKQRHGELTALDPVNSPPPIASLELVHPYRIALAAALAAGAYFPFAVNRGSLPGAKTLGSSRGGCAVSWEADSSRTKPIMTLRVGYQFVVAPIDHDVDRPRSSRGCLLAGALGPSLPWLVLREELIFDPSLSTFISQFPPAESPETLEISFVESLESSQTAAAPLAVCADWQAIAA
ncbi:uncharacterized protein N7498_006222 [Penicillium cinerascens]|uniref:Uncharacterized protein n=1 Tax=Penicillium cinerascens TaxID=70096 RepID=A0A9W9SX25_9EURO|nr:uncharacterized protein N7498_006222 [Penicillium cinerascens]KAJ5201559.1 hypothetical protein N7498_006222 [Penicillium cinerascens]